ncbi:hypothetical protein RO3G_14055 [Rhizopus delemar RA 99-880]|uniref:Uncharacterized protein n=1 Tax=Rhizopus delemar (strain RA 99-880 / ATCC MYA-4621 / FGSC 9543 / NRRL 43880) TaxID=246409 RepID=I1CLL4_RHIO9|nr:hypothetical protein RO3G_14055 [Rhizopus delemar RA 99-880]|eukprot:EIE89344.1 hypothetical protein RO3G_14055 [Rhizopus delemar RA 99-880]
MSDLTILFCLPSGKITVGASGVVPFLLGVIGVLGVFAGVRGDLVAIRGDFIGVRGDFPGVRLIFWLFFGVLSFFLGKFLLLPTTDNTDFVRLEDNAILCECFNLVGSTRSWLHDFIMTKVS